MLGELQADFLVGFAYSHPVDFWNEIALAVSEGLVLENCFLVIEAAVRSNLQELYLAVDLQREVVNMV